ncbi:hypothetical protein J4E90_008107 [Alternaria incomplexa]|uniref:uncharacterized protein n=1 Tax=Alternaria incomplexa TaxID=1187928 RepID=UPI0022206D4F|nr:uncharacterized protein J4E90_008107 [Alternaria incomplexa]KAI4909410.1 hypothetical protein J4E90_008107 [Alternaria incomplexa]
MPAEHGKLVDEDVMAPLPPTSEEMKRFELDVERTYESWGKSKGRRAYCFPAKVSNDHGIRVDEFMGALQNSLPAIRDTWLMNADRLVEEIQQAHWIDDIWTIPGAPTIRVYLDNVDMLDERNVINLVPSSDEFLAYHHARARVLGLSSHITRAAQMDAEPFRRSREKAWISEDLIEPAESTTGRHPINWHR